MRCVNCGSYRIQWIDREYPTGVVAPDGVQERWNDKGYHCEDCGAFEDDYHHDDKSEEDEGLRTK